MSAYDTVMERVKHESRHMILTFGAEGIGGVQAKLRADGWESVEVVDTAPIMSSDGSQFNMTVIVTSVGPDPWLVRTLDGYWVRAMTVKEIFGQFSGPYGVIVIAGTGIDRRIWYDECVQDALPAVYMLPEDGHNEDVVRLADARGYTPVVADGWLVLTKDEG